MKIHKIDGQPFAPVPFHGPGYTAQLDPWKSCFAKECDLDLFALIEMMKGNHEIVFSQRRNSTNGAVELNADDTTGRFGEALHINASRLTGDVRSVLLGVIMYDNGDTPASLSHLSEGMVHLRNASDVEVFSADLALDKMESVAHNAVVFGDLVPSADRRWSFSPRPWYTDRTALMERYGLDYQF